MKSIKFRDIEVAYDEKVLKSWKFQRKLTSLGDEDRVFFVADSILCGMADEVAEQLDDDVEAMGELLNAISEDMGIAVKN